MTLATRLFVPRNNLIVLCWLQNPEERTPHIEAALHPFGPCLRLASTAWWVQTEKPERSVRYALAIDPGPLAHGSVDDDFYIVNASMDSIDSWQDGRNLMSRLIDMGWRKAWDPGHLAENVTPLDPRRRR